MAVRYELKLSFGAHVSKEFSLKPRRGGGPASKDETITIPWMSETLTISVTREVSIAKLNRDPKTDNLTVVLETVMVTSMSEFTLIGEFLEKATWIPSTF